MQPTPTSAEPRAIPALVSYLHPFTIIANDDDKSWNVTVEQVNRGTWDYVKPHEIVGQIDVGLTPPLSMVVGFDGALGLPPIPELMSVPKAVEFFNRCLGAILLGGIYCEAVTLDHVERGTILDWKYLRSAGSGLSFANQFHAGLRTRMASIRDAIFLVEPRRTPFARLQIAAKNGFDILSVVPTLTPEFLLKGVTAMARQDWTGAVANLWVIVEQLTEYLWSREVLGDLLISQSPIPGRREQLRDARTWTAATKQEMLYQKGCYGIEVLRSLCATRKSRNALVHQGSHPDSAAAVCAFASVKGLFIAASPGGMHIPLFELNLDDHAVSDPFRKPPTISEAAYWHYIPMLPNEIDINREERKPEPDDASAKRAHPDE